ncbi:membrane protein insertion efficiency factor YidD [Deinococcus cavernae]|uniref:Putative membrane protein insertion efficiency factor n=1 Tax=Deinococcus cavernae TaxID=2320857 RepID=A0A418VAA3_9DEIO|nr:membrane protein insertion efficiency factor YidD [Deinococcus cavernae]
MSEPVSNGLASGGAGSGDRAARGLVRIVRAYQHHLSPRKPAPTCRFTPTCSEYAAQAIERFGAVKGGWLATWRIMRCNPLVEGGFDPVPTHFPKNRKPQDQSEKTTHS